MSTQTRFKIDGMDCAACAAKIDTAARRASGIEDVSISVAKGTMTLHHAPECDLEALARRIASLGYRLTPLAGIAATPSTPDAPGVPCCGHDHGQHDHAARRQLGHEHAGHNHAGHDHHDHHDHHNHPAQAGTAASGDEARNRHPATPLQAEAWWRGGKAGAILALSLIHI